MFSVVGDPHIKNSNLELAEALFAWVESKGRSTIWLGDLLDTKELIRGKSLNAFLTYFAKSKLHHYVLVGNHDWFNLECEAHSLESLKLLPNVTVVDKPMLFQDGITLPLFMVPYIHDRNELLKALDSAPAGAVLFAHLDVANHDYGNGHLSKDGLQLEDLSKFRRVISGHFHKFQQSGILTYLGTPFSHSFGEANQDKFLGSYDSDLDTLELEPSPFRKHISIEINADTFEELDIDHMRDQLVPDHLYRIILSGTEESIQAFPKEGLAHLDVKWVTRPSDFVTNDVQIDETASNEVQFARWATNVKKLDLETLQLGLDIMGAVK